MSAQGKCLLSGEAGKANHEGQMKLVRPSELLNCTPGRVGGGVLPSLALTGTCRPIRYGFRGYWLERGIDFLTSCFKQGIVTQPYKYMFDLQKPHHKLNSYQFANVQYIEERNSL